MSRLDPGAVSDDSRFRLATAQYALRRPRTWGQYADRVGEWVATGAGAGAQLLVFPEYAGLELAGLTAADDPLTLPAACAALQDHLDAFRDLHAGLAARHGVAIVAGSLPVGVAGGPYRNRVHVFAPDGRTGIQDKLQLTRHERRLGFMEAGDSLRVFDLGPLRLGVTLCYDVQFPLLGRALAGAGADLVVAPSCTEAATGFNRVRTAARARALENQCFTAQAAVRGDAPWMPMAAHSVGAAGVFTPPDHGFPSDGVLADGDDDGAEERWVVADLDLTGLRRLRHSGQVANFDDWDGQYRAATLAVEAGWD